MKLYREAIERFRNLLERAARESGQSEPMAMTLATADADGRPSARMVLLRGLDERGLAFYGQSISGKGRQLLENARAAACMYWDRLGEQVRAEGRVAPIPDDETDAYWNGRPRESRIGAWASLQSLTLDRRETLEERVKGFKARFQATDVPRPQRWVGYRLVPDLLEFWTSRPHRLHERVVFERDGEDCWTRRLLFP